MASLPALLFPAASLVGRATRTTTTLIPAGRGLHARRAHRGTVACLGGDRSPEAASADPDPRRSANYQPTLWPDSFIQTLTSSNDDSPMEEEGDTAARLEELKGLVRGWLSSDVGGSSTTTAAKLELLDAVRRLGVSYHFEAETEAELHALYAKLEEVLQELDGDLLHTALLFRLLREHGIPVPPKDVFKRFRDEKGGFKSSLMKDVEGILSLYEASFLALRGENILEEARAFAGEGLQEYLLQPTATNNIDGDVQGHDDDTSTKLRRERVEHAMEMPLHWRMPRLYARWFIDIYERDDQKSIKASPDQVQLVELAKLDFNVVQDAHKRDVKETSRWWKDLGLHKLDFARDRLMECFFWTLGIIFEPQFSHCRRGLTRIFTLIATIDDVYDVYGSIDELESFTKAVARWDVDALEELPDYMKVCFQALWKTTNELADQCLQRNGFNCLSYLKRSWIDLCDAFLIEARWHHRKHMPTLEEYLENAWVSASGPVILTHAYFMLSENIRTKELDSIRNYGDLIRWSSTIFRLSNDLVTSVAEVERGDVPASIQCHMHESGVSELVARKYIKLLINNVWNRMNEEVLLNKHFPTPFVKAAINLARMSLFLYQNGDGFSAPDKETKYFVNLLLIEPTINEVDFVALCKF